MRSQRLSGRRMVMEMLRAERVTHIFGNPGTSEMPLLDALEDYPEMAYVLALHEGVAVGMADGYARISGRPAFVSLHIDTGLANGISLLADSAEGGTPLVLSSANKDIRKLAEGRTDLPQMVAQFTKWSAEASHPEQIPGLMRRAFHEARSAPTGPAYVGFSANALHDEAEVEIVASGPLFDRIGPDPRAIETAVALLADATRPLLLVGDRVGQSGACDAAVRVAELLGAEVYATCLGRVNFPSAHALYCGALGQLFPATRSMLASADVVLAVGTNVFGGFFYFSGRALGADSQLIHIDSAAREVGKSEPTAVGIVADPQVALLQLAQGLEGALGVAQRAAAQRRLQQATQRRAKAQTLREQAHVKAGRGAAGPMQASQMMRALAQALPPDAVLLDDAISSSAALHQAVELTAADCYQGRGGAAIGWGMGAALGIKLAEPGRPVVAVIGDGSAMMGIQALWTAAMARIAVVYVICNNRAYRVLKQNMHTYQREILKREAPRSNYIGMDLPPHCDLAALSRAMGVHAVTIKQAAALGPALAAALARNEPVLLDVIIDGAL